jgi:glutamate synthase (NADPH/NADH) small chain
MLADEDEIREAVEEGITVLPARGPRCCVIEDGELVCLETVACLSIFDEQGRFHPCYNEADLMTHPADMVVEAIDQGARLDFLDKEFTERLDWERGRIKVSRDGHTSLPWLWAAGDVVEGPDVVHAVAAGHRVAESIHQYLTQQYLTQQHPGPAVTAAILILANSPCFWLRGIRLEALQHERHQVPPALEAQVTGQGANVTE